MREKGTSVLIELFSFCHRCRFLREMDRKKNEYPKLYYPELYLMNGGYKAFSASYLVCDHVTKLLNLTSSHFSCRISVSHRVIVLCTINSTKRN